MCVRSGVELDLDVRMHDPPDAEIRIELLARCVDVDLTGTVHDRSLTNAAKKRNEPVGVIRIAKEEPQGEEPFARYSTFHCGTDSLQGVICVSPRALRGPRPRVSRASHRE